MLCIYGVTEALTYLSEALQEFCQGQNDYSTPHPEIINSSISLNNTPIPTTTLPNILTSSGIVVNSTTDPGQTSSTDLNTSSSMITHTTQTNKTQTWNQTTPKDFLTNHKSNVLETEDNNNKQKTAAESPTQSDRNSVFVPLLVCGLILAAILIGLYLRKYHCHSKAKGMKLAEERCMADEENQGNTLVSVAPLNPPESPEKPSQNGESLEAAKNQNPPGATNGHSTTKADTEL
ncbi:hypothetical protein C0J45_14369 [Silurus meridionalis]|nr:hypothetical protein C0J45_14369 [Silurus meridionalis]